MYLDSGEKLHPKMRENAYFIDLLSAGTAGT